MNRASASGAPLCSAVAAAAELKAAETSIPAATMKPDWRIRVVALFVPSQQITIKGLNRSYHRASGGADFSAPVAGLLRVHEKVDEDKHGQGYAQQPREKVRHLQPPLFTMFGRGAPATLVLTRARGRTSLASVPENRLRCQSFPCTPRWFR